MVFTGGYSNKYPYGSDQCHANKRSEAKQNEENEADGIRRNKTKRKEKEDEESSKDETDKVSRHCEDRRDVAIQ